MPEIPFNPERNKVMRAEQKMEQPSIDPRMKENIDAFEKLGFSVVGASHGYVDMSEGLPWPSIDFEITGEKDQERLMHLLSLFYRRDRHLRPEFIFRVRKSGEHALRMDFDELLQQKVRDRALSERERLGLIEDLRIRSWEMEKFTGFLKRAVELGDNLEKPRTGEEVAFAFQNADLELDSSFADLLWEDEKKFQNRFGSGFTQASYFLGNNFVRFSRSDRDVNLISSEMRMRMADVVFKDGDEYGLQSGKIKSLLDRETYARLLDKISLPENKLLTEMIGDILELRDREEGVGELLAAKEKIKIGSCTTAEVYFYDYARKDGKNAYNYSNGYQRKAMNLFIDSFREPLFFEKVGLGENHSAISLKSFYLNGVRIPAGSLVALQYDGAKKGAWTKSGRGQLVDSTAIEGVEFLRFTPLVVDPRDRRRAFSKHVDFQEDNHMYRPADLRVQDFVDLAREEMKEPSGRG